MPRPMPSPRLLATVLSIWALSAAELAAAPDAAAVTRADVEAFSAGAEQAWAQVTDGRGAVADPLQPERGRFNYGTLMLADAQLRGAAREDDRSLADAAVRQTLGTIERLGPQDTYYLLAAGTMLRNGLAGRFPDRAWRRLEGPLRR